MRPLPTHLQSYQYVPELAFDMAEDDSPTGMVRAVVASLEVADSWGRIVHAGAVGSQEVIVSEWAHSAIWNDAPVGVGRVYEENNSLLAELQYDMEREAGKNAYTMVRGLGKLAQWSIAYDPAEMEERNGQIHFWAVDMIETSPCARGASPGTRTVEVQDRSRILQPGAAWLEMAKMQAEIAARRM